MDEAAAAIVNEDIAAAIWLQTFQPRWYHGVSTGTELDLMIFVILLPAILIFRLTTSQPNKSIGFREHEGPVYCVQTPTRIVFLAAETKWFSHQLTRELLACSKDDLSEISFSHSHRTPVTFRFADDQSCDLFFSGVWSDLAEFQAAALTGQTAVNDSR